MTENQKKSEINDIIENSIDDNENTQHSNESNASKKRKRENNGDVLKSNKLIKEKIVITTLDCEVSPPAIYEDTLDVSYSESYVKVLIDHFKELYQIDEFPELAEIYKSESESILIIMKFITKLQKEYNYVIKYRVIKKF